MLLVIIVIFIIVRGTHRDIIYKFYRDGNINVNPLKKSVEGIVSFHTGKEDLCNYFNLGSGCTWKFDKYTPSAWEVYWLANVENFQYNICPILDRPEEIEKSADTLRRIMSLQKSIFDTTSKSLPVDKHLSKMHYRATCDGKEYEIIQLIEPLVGLIRDPLTMCPENKGVPPDLQLKGEADLQSKRFLLLAPSSPFEIDPSYSSIIPPIPPWMYTPGSQKILIDIGSSYFQSRNGNTDEIGTKWFYDYFKAKSIQFDRIIAYEHQKLEDQRVWEELPDDVFPIYTFINVGVSDKIGKFNPWTTLEAIAKPNDYVIVKLDIDTPPLESALMKQLLDVNSSARHLIDELFFEKHVTVDKNSPEDKLRDSYALFTKLREYGIRMHGWP